MLPMTRLAFGLEMPWVGGMDPYIIYSAVYTAPEQTWCP